jgi:hypothetical protein
MILKLVLDPSQMAGLSTFVGSYSNTPRGILVHGKEESLIVDGKEVREVRLSFGNENIITDSFVRILKATQHSPETSDHRLDVTLTIATHYNYRGDPGFGGDVYKEDMPLPLYAMEWIFAAMRLFPE